MKHLENIWKPLEKKTKKMGSTKKLFEPDLLRCNLSHSSLNRIQKTFSEADRTKKQIIAPVFGMLQLGIWGEHSLADFFQCQTGLFFFSPQTAV